jgi:L-threonate 2-dehydrogenase
MDKTVGIVGLGIMGGAIARNLIDREWRVIGFDIDAARRSELALANVTIASDVRQLARDAPIIMTSLPSPAAVEDIAHAIANPVSLDELWSNSRRSASPTNSASGPS